MIYHEKQELYRCGIHALNNALQGGCRSVRVHLLLLTQSADCLSSFATARVFDKATLDAACEHLAALSNGGSSSSSLLGRVWNPHRAPLGLGNYDVNVLMFVMEARGASVTRNALVHPLLPSRSLAHDRLSTHSRALPRVQDTRSSGSTSADRLTRRRSTWTRSTACCATS